MSDYCLNESTVEERNTDLFNEIADVLDFTPEQYDQTSWGRFAPDADARDTWREQFPVTETSSPYERFGTGIGDTEDIRWLEVKECGTAMCVAGHAANLSGWHPVMINVSDEEGVTELSWSSVSETPFSVKGTGIEPVAIEALGITEDEADILFGSTKVWSGDDLRKFGKGERITVLDTNQE